MILSECSIEDEYSLPRLGLCVNFELSRWRNQSFD